MSSEDRPDRGLNLGAYIRMRRKANRLTQVELAELTGVGLRFVKDVERGKPTARMDTVNAVLAAFGKQLGIVDAPPPEDGILDAMLLANSAT